LSPGGEKLSNIVFDRTAFGRAIADFGRNVPSLATEGMLSALAQMPAEITRINEVTVYPSDKVAQVSGGTPWMDTALGEYNAGVKEVPMGSNSGPRVDVYLKYAGVSSPNSWCAAFVNWCLGQNGIKGAGARPNDYLTWGTDLKDPKYGSLVIFKQSHIGFYMGKNADGTLKILHGNWSNKVTISSGVYDPIYPSQIKQYRFPKY
jgi:uncharacterized protein (TIGR02594 family)